MKGSEWSESYSFTIQYYSDNQKTVELGGLVGPTLGSLADFNSLYSLYVLLFREGDLVYLGWLRCCKRDKNAILEGYLGTKAF